MVEIPNFINRHLPVELVNSKQIKLFNRSGITDFLSVDPILWKENEGYKRAKNRIGSIKVVNVTTESHVKLMEEFNSKIAKNEFLLQVKIFFQ